MPREGDKWKVVSGDCLWNIANSVYGDPYKWTSIADANGIPRNRTTIFPGQYLILPGITSGSSSPAPTPPQPAPPINRCNIEWYALVAGSERDMLAVWTYGDSNHFQIRWEQWDATGHLILISEQNVEIVDRAKQSTGTGLTQDGSYVIRFSVRPIDDQGNPKPNTDWAWQEYDFRNNPPLLPPDPTVEINSNNSLSVTFNNINEDINADSIEIVIYQDDTIKYKTATVRIDKEINFAKYTTDVEPGHYYKVRCRAVRGNIYGGWTNFTSNDQSVPIAPERIITLKPQVISEQMSKEYGVFIEWTPVNGATHYEVQWTTNLDYFQSDNVSSKTTEESQGSKLLITDIEVGHEYFFRVRSINDKGSSVDWCPIKSIKLGSKPSAPTTWSNTNSAVLGEDLNLYWTHNSTDGSFETFARLNIIVIDSANPDREPMEYTKVIENTKPEDEKNTNSIYKINTNDPEWAMVQNGFIIKWKVQTAGILGEYSPWSIEREVNVYAKPNISLDIINREGSSTEQINNFPFYFSILATPQTQKPISYYIEVIANEGYNTMDNVGNVKTVNPGDKIYQKYYDPERNSWRFLLEMTPSNIDLESGINYTINATVAMDSGLDASATQDFLCNFDDQSYQVYANVSVDKDTLIANISPYCNEYYEENGEVKTRLYENCKLAVFRRQYDSTFMEIASEIDNINNTYVVDPHPSLDYARYRIVARTNDTGAISYADVTGVLVNDPNVVIQWSEKWSNFDYDNSSEHNVEKPWAGSMIKIPYNIDISETKSVDVSLIEYTGRNHPVSYYGTQEGETSTWNVNIPAYDKEMIYALRRLSKYKGDVYVREPSGTGYWANISLSFSKNHLETVIPVTFSIRRVEGGI